eukprot:EG_transcript_54782
MTQHISTGHSRPSWEPKQGNTKWGETSSGKSFEAGKKLWGKGIVSEAIQLLVAAAANHMRAAASADPPPLHLVRKKAATSICPRQQAGDQITSKASATERFPKPSSIFHAAL